MTFDPVRRHVRPTAAAAVVDGVTASLDAAASRHFAAAGDAGSSLVHLPRTGPGSARVRRHARPRLTQLVAVTALAACACVLWPSIAGGA